MKKILLSIMLATALTACGEKAETPKENTKPVVKIGVIDALSGKYAENGKNVQQAIEFAKQDFPYSAVDFEFIFEDYGYDAIRASSAANKLINIDKVNALITWSSIAGNIVSPLAEPNKILHFSISNDEKVAKGKYNFTHFTPSEALAEKLVKQIEDMGAKKIALFAVYQPALQKHTNAVEKILKEKDIEYERFDFGIDNKDFVLMLEKAKNKNFDVLFLCALPPSLDVFLRTYFLRKIAIPLVAIDSLLFAGDKNLVEGMKFVSSPDGDQELLNKLTAKNGSTNYFSVGYAYDVATLLMKAYTELYKKNNNVPTSDDVVNYLMKLNGYKGAVGELFINQDGVVFSPAVIKQIINGQPVVVEE
ncbi:MAG: amino acid ABC transporter substrate-binding protein [Alphaproteobacteria bacterium]|nr:amino acid ABC transporter substrate-binding protein [Alphaproteobacteria bacterium]